MALMSSCAKEARHGRVDCKGLNRARTRFPRSRSLRAVDVHRFRERVVHHFAHQRMVGNLDVASHRLRAGGGVREDAGEKIIRACALDSAARRACPSACAAAAASGPPAQRQRFLKSGEGMQACSSRSRRSELGQEVKDVGEREAVLLGERDVDAVVGGGGLQLEVEAAAEAFAQRESPGLVDAAAERGACRMSCWPPPSSKKRSAMMVVLVGTAPSAARPRNNVGDELARSGVGQTKHSRCEKARVSASWSAGVSGGEGFLLSDEGARGQA